MSDSSSRRSFIKAAGTATAAATTLSGCLGGDGGSPTGTKKNKLPDEFPVTITQGQMPTTLDPHDHRSTPTDIVMMQAYEGVISRDRKGKIIPMLATDWERKEPGRVRFKIRKGPTFHKTGNELKPEDVAYSINRIVKKNVGIASPQAGQLLGVTGAKVVDGERAVDVMSDGLNPLVFDEFATYCDIIEKQWAKKHDPSYIAQNMNGTGPFEMTDFKKEVRVVMKRYEDYWQQPAAPTKLTFNAAKKASTRANMLIEGETDLTVNIPPQQVTRVEKSQNASVSAVPSTRIIFNAMRYDVEPFSSPKFRRAMNYAVDLKSIIKNVLEEFGDATDQPTLEGFFGYNSDLSIYPHDPAKAEKLVEESGHAGVDITLHTPVGRYLKDVQIAQAVANMIDQLDNVNCEVKQREFGKLAGELVDGKIETSPKFYLIGWGNATFNAIQTIRPLLTSSGAVTSYKNEKVDGMIERAMNVKSRKKRDNILQDTNKFLHDDAPWIYLNRQYSVYGQSSRIKWKPRRDERIDAYAIEPAKSK